MKKLYLVFLLLTMALFCLCGAGFAKSLNESNATMTIPKTDLTLEEYVKEVRTINESIVNHHVNTSSNIRNSGSSNSQDAPSTITFAKRLSFAEVENYTVKHNIKGYVLEARALLDDGTRMTFWTRLNNGYDEAEKSLMKALDDNSCKKFLGFVGMYASVPVDNFDDVENDAATFLLDASQSSLYYNSTKTTIDNSQETNNTQAFPKTLAWQLEELKIIH